MKKIKITQNKYALVDDSDYEWLNQWKWQWKPTKRMRTGYVERTQRVKGTKLKLHIKMHRLIIDAKKGQIVDHKNRDGLDNRRSNLRFCTLSQNNQNFPIPSNNKSGYKGVSLHKHSGLWRANVVLNGKQYSLGYFEDIKQAGLAYNNRAKELFGEFARINEILK